MFRFWSAANFKSIGDTQTLQLAPLTVLAGANNSGKSSLLQSILILAQTVRSARDEPALVLDGDLFRRGEAEELIHSGRRRMSFAFEADITGQRVGTQPAGTTVRVSVEFRVMHRPEWGERRFELVNSSLAVLDDKRQPLDSIGVDRRRSWRGKVGSAPPAWLQRHSLDYRPTEGEERYADVVAISLSHFLPQWAFERRDAKSERYQELLRYIVVRRAVGHDPTLEDEALELARVLIREPHLESLSTLTPRQRGILRAHRGTEAPRSSAHLFAHLKGDYRWRRRPLSPIIDDCVASLRALARGVRHLGPLRVPPQFVYAPAPYSQEGAVGSTGEYTVAELHRNLSSEVSSVDPVTGTPTTVTLQAAVENWLGHMGIVESVLTWHRPKVGHYLFVKPPQLDQYVDLTNVGVGASQVLPVLVQALVAPPGSVLIFEQPELHLHPRVQSILADFFIGLARTGRQCLVETHSEHIVNRLRFRIAEADTEDLQTLSRIYFAERENGQTEFRPVTINEYGAPEEWPEGFFDDSHLEAERILRSSMRKRTGRG